MEALPASQCGTDNTALREATDAAAAVFTTASRRRAAMQYLRQRGIDTPGLPSPWVIGYAPPGWTRLVDAFAGRFPEDVLLDAGLARRSSRGSLIDTFRDRVVFGIRDQDGTLAGFIGRDVSGSSGGPKYLNTREHALFDKGSLLFGLYEGVEAGGCQPVIVEGPLDVLAIASRTRPDDGELLPVAPCGTSFTSTQAEYLASLAFAHRSPVVVAMDGDAPGRSAAIRVGERLRGVGVDARIATLPNGTDPAEFLARPGTTLDVFRADHAVPLLAVHVEHAITVQGDGMQWIEGRLAALRSVARYLGTYPPAYTARQVGWLSDVLDLQPTTVTAALVDAYRPRPHAALSSPSCAPAATRAPAI